MYLSNLAAGHGGRADLDDVNLSSQGKVLHTHWLLHHIHAYIGVYPHTYFMQCVCVCAQRVDFHDVSMQSEGLCMCGGDICIFCENVYAPIRTCACI
jgi:hypothetical protein